MKTGKVQIPEKLGWVFEGNARYRGAYGGRGSGKTRTFAMMAAIRGYMLAAEGKTGVIVCAREFMNSLADSSFAEIKGAIKSLPWLEPFYQISEQKIKTTRLAGRIEFIFSGLRTNIDSIKSKSKIHLFWVDEAEPVAETAWQKIIPTVREKDSEIWVTWNPERETSATHMRFRANPPEDARIVKMNWRDNPWFPDVLGKERLSDKARRPDSYDHIWEGDFVTYVEGAYFTAHLTQAREEGRIGKVARDPLMQIRAFWDIGGTGAKSDATAIWIAQFITREIRVLDYYEAQGQPLATHVNWLRENGYGQALCVLPHDGATHDRVVDVSFESALRQAGFEVSVIANQGAGAARLRIEAARRLFDSIWFDEERTRAGVDALGWYHEKRDDNRNIGLGPEHDWASHGADAFGLMCIAYEQPSTRPAGRIIRTVRTRKGLVI